MSDYHAALTARLAAAGIPHVMHIHPPMATVEEVAAIAPHFLATMVKTIVFRIKDGPLVLAAALGSDRIDYKKVADYLGVSRRQLRPLAAAELLAALGVAPGGVAPLRPAADAHLLLDARLAALPVVNTGSGRLTHTLEINPHDLARLSAAPFVPITK